MVRFLRGLRMDVQRGWIESNDNYLLGADRSTPNAER